MREKKFGGARTLEKKSSGRRDEFRQKIVEIGAIFVIFEPLQDFLFGNDDVSCLEHEECPAWNTRNVLLGTHGTSCLEHTECPAWNTRNVLRGTHEMSCLEHKKEMSCVEHMKTDENFTWVGCV